MTAEHWILLAGFLAASGTCVAGLDSWSEALKPAFVAGMLAQIALFLRMMYTPNAGVQK